METWIIVAIGAAAAVGVLLIAWALIAGARSRGRSEQLRKDFRSEYDRELARDGDRKVAERALEERRQRVAAYDLRNLTEAERLFFAERWRGVQADFVNFPAESIARADELLGGVMLARGYEPSRDPAERAGDLSVGYPEQAEAYRRARQIVAANGAGQATTEDLRQAMLLYARVLDPMLLAHPRAPEPAPAASRDAAVPSHP
jgi:hypothetical protein